MIFRFFQMAPTASAAILNFRNFKFLTVGAVERAVLRHCAKFRKHRSNCGQDMAIFRFFKMAADAILDFKNFKIEEGRTSSLCQSSSKSLKPRPRYQSFFRFCKMAAVRHLGWVMHILGPSTMGIWWSLSMSKIWLESME